MTLRENEYNPFSLDLSGKDTPLPLRLLGSIATPLLERVFSLKDFQDLRRQVYRELEVPAPSRPDQCTVSALEVVRKAHSLMNVSWNVHGSSLERIPREGPVVLVANHPFGGIEATLLLEILLSIRPDVRFLANFILRRLPETEEFSIYVDPFNRQQSTRLNLTPIRESINWVRMGGLLCIFPSGTVSHWHFKTREVTDPPWSPTVGRIIRKAECPVVPIFIRGRNNWLFQTAGVIHPILRTALLPHEFLNKRGKQINLMIGNPISFEKLEAFKTDEELIAYLRLRTYILGNTSHVPQSAGESTATETEDEAPPPEAVPDKPATPEFPDRTLEELAPPVPREILIAEVARLPERCRLVTSGDMSVYCARAKQIPNVLKEIGRLREATFRSVLEGTGKSEDVDRFDSYYQHLFIWSRKNEEIVGAYRLGRTDQILRHFGRNGLYTSTLFAYRPQILEQLGASIEVGRSFVREEYQRSYTPLLLLWKGIGHYVVRHPNCRILFGPVSINADYDSVSRQLITAFLKANNCLPHVARLIKPRNPMPRSRVMGLDPETTSVVVKDLHEVSELLKEIESRQESVPVLLKQYLKLGGRLIGFNLDPSFGHVLDGLIYVDLLETEPRLLERYMGAEGIRSFYAFHKKPGPHGLSSGKDSRDDGKQNPEAEDAAQK